jgi:hypothetical protein
MSRVDSPSLIPPDEPIPDLRVRVTRQRGGSDRPRQRSPYDRFVDAYARVLFAILKALVGAVCSVVVIVAAIWLIITSDPRREA